MLFEVDTDFIDDEMFALDTEHEGEDLLLENMFYQEDGDEDNENSEEDDGDEGTADYQDYSDEENEI